MTFNRTTQSRDDGGEFGLRFFTRPESDLPSFDLYAEQERSLAEWVAAGTPSYDTDVMVTRQLKRVSEVLVSDSTSWRGVRA